MVCDMLLYEGLCGLVFKRAGDINLFCCGGPASDIVYIQFSDECFSPLLVSRAQKFCRVCRAPGVRAYQMHIYMVTKCAHGKTVRANVPTSY